MDEKQWRTCTNPDEMLAFLADKATERLLRRFALACHRRLTPEPAAGDRERFEAAERHADWPAAVDAWASDLTGGHFPSGVTSSDGHSSWYIGWLPGFYARAASRLAAGPPILEPQESAARCHLLRDIFGDLFVRPRMEASWLVHDGHRVPKIARAIYTGQAFDGLPVLADALVDAGCDDEALVRHLREPGPHVRGCWALDWCLGWRSMYRAIEEGDAPFLAALLASGADVDSFYAAMYRPMESHSPLSLAVVHERLDVVQLLLEAGADPRDYGDNWPMIAAVWMGHVEIVRALLAAGAAVEAVEGDDGQGGPLITACNGGQFAVAKLLLEAGASVNGATECGDTSLMGAASRGELEIVRLLVEAGASLSQRAFHNNATALMMAMCVESPRRDEVVAYLRELSTPEQIREADAYYQEHQASRASGSPPDPRPAGAGGA